MVDATYTVEVTGHREVSGHTTYVIEGTANGAPWRAERRLSEMRALHDRVVEALGPARYDTFFADASFAPRGGLPGTTAKLNRWCKRLFESLRYVPDGQLAFALDCLGAPRPADIPRLVPLRPRARFATSERAPSPIGAAAAVVAVAVVVVVVDASIFSLATRQRKEHAPHARADAVADAAGPLSRALSSVVGFALHLTGAFLSFVVVTGELFQLNRRVDADIAAFMEESWNLETTETDKKTKGIAEALFAAVFSGLIHALFESILKVMMLPFVAIGSLCVHVVELLLKFIPLFAASLAMPFVLPPHVAAHLCAFFKGLGAVFYAGLLLGVLWLMARGPRRPAPPDSGGSPALTRRRP